MNKKSFHKKPPKSKLTQKFKKNQKPVSTSYSSSSSLSRSTSPNAQDYDDDFEEGQTTYRQGGYHPVLLGDIFHDRYIIRKKLGWGHFSTVWLAENKDIPIDQPSHFSAIKIQKSANHYTEAALDEIDMLEALSHPPCLYLNHNIHEKDQQNNIIQDIMSNESKINQDSIELTLDHNNSIQYPLCHCQNSKNEKNPFSAQLQDFPFFYHGYHHVLKIKDHFFHNGINGKHVCLTFDVLGENILNWIIRFDYQGLPRLVVKYISIQLLYSLLYIHHCQLIHTDLKPENVMLYRRHSITQEELDQYQQYCNSQYPSTLQNILSKVKNPSLNKNQKKKIKVKLKKYLQHYFPLSSQPHPLSSLQQNHQESEDEIIRLKDIQCCIVDFGFIPSQPSRSRLKVLAHISDHRSGFLLDNLARSFDLIGNACWIHKHFTDDVITTRQYRSPEVILGYQYSTPVDIFSLGCLIFELYTGEYLYEPKDGLHKNHPFSRDDDHLALMIEMMGEMPDCLLTGRFAHHYFDQKKKMKKIQHLENWSLDSILQEKYNFEPEESHLFADFIEKMVDLHPLQRSSPQSLLLHPWLQLSDEDMEFSFTLPPLPSNSPSISPIDNSFSNH